MPCVDCGSTEHVFEDRDGLMRCLAHLYLYLSDSKPLEAEFEKVWNDNIEQLYEP